MSLPQLANAQDRQRAGKPIGKVSTDGNLIVLELDDGVLGQEHLFDINGRTLRFSPSANGYRVENLPLEWDSDFGNEISEAEVTLHKFQFPFAGAQWSSFSAGANGSIRFGEPQREGEGARRGLPGSGSFRFGGVSLARFEQLSEAPGTLINSVSGICVFLKLRMSGKGYVKELDDRVLVTWDLTEPWGNIQDFTWTKTVNQFQAALFRDGTIKMSYKELAAKDGVVGVFPIVTNAAEKTIATLTNKQRSGAPGYLDLRKVTAANVGGTFLKINLNTSAAVLKDGDSNLPGIGYRVHFKPHGRSAAEDSEKSDVVWAVRGFAPRQRNGGGTSRYVAFGPGLSREVKTSGNNISIQGILPPALRDVAQVDVSAEAFAAGDSSTPASHVAAAPLKLSSIRSPEVEFSKLKQGDGPYPIVYESFHYYALPNARDLTCSLIKTLGDKFDFLAYYSDFRVDNQEAGTPSNGPRGGNVTGIGSEQGN
ncbi:MAG TPA: hypothetical protein VJR04_02605, partial [Terriglobales bacterium]|nr:hypothetical protein [Terriglobales bacterium]